MPGNRIHDAWRKRSARLGDNMRSVMDQSFPSSINTVIHNIHVHEILSVMPAGNIRCLDVGCGYGRLAEALIRQRPNMYVDGVDIAPTFVRFFNKKLQRRGRAIVADARVLPFKSGSFDMVWMVVTLMYFPKVNDQRKILGEIYRVLKPGGTLILIEPNMVGEFIVRWGGILPKIHSFILHKRKEYTSGVAFFPNVLSCLLEEVSFTIISRRGYPLVTLFLIPLVVIGKILPSIAGWCLDGARRIDRLLPVSSFSYIVTFAARKYE